MLLVVLDLHSMQILVSVALSLLFSGTLPDDVAHGKSPISGWGPFYLHWET